MALGGNVPAFLLWLLPASYKSRMVVLEEAGPQPSSSCRGLLPQPHPPNPSHYTSVPCLPFTMPFLHEVFAHAVPTVGTLFPVLL